MLSILTPPSTSTSTLSPRRSISRRTARSFSRLLGDEALSAEARMHAHHQDHVEMLGRGEHPLDRRVSGLIAIEARAPSSRIRCAIAGKSRKPRACTEIELAPAFDECFEVARGLRNHQMRIERQPGYLAHRFQHRHADREVRHEMPVHHVEMNQVGAGLFDPANLFAQAREVGGQNRRRNFVLFSGSSPKVGAPQICYRSR